jgi:uncharacterized membrane protein
MDQRPKLKLPLSRGDILLEMLAFSLLLISWLLAIYGLITLPDSIPVHFDMTGSVTRYGGKFNILITPLITTALFIGMSILNKYPHIFNYPYPISTENAEKQYRAASRLIRWLKFLMVALFLFIDVVIIQAARHSTNIIPSWLFFFVLLLSFAPIAIYLISARSSR